MNHDSKGSHRLLCFAGLFDEAVIKEMERYADARAYRIDNGSLLLCRRKPMGQGVIDRAISFGWTVQPLPKSAHLPEIPGDKSLTKEIPVIAPHRSPSRLTLAERKVIVRRWVRSVERGDWKKPRKS